VVVVGYYPIAILVLIAVGMATVLLWLPSRLAPRRPDAEKLSPYECGMPPVGDARERFNIWFYVIGMEFIIFLGIIALSLVYAWKRVALQWE